LRDQSVKLGPPSDPMNSVCTCERTNAPFDQLLEIIRRIGMRKTNRRQHSGQDVLCSMLGLAREIDDLRLAPFVLGYVASDFRCADDFALRISDG
jgi:hypothetical protein